MDLAPSSTPMMAKRKSSIKIKVDDDLQTRIARNACASKRVRTMFRDAGEQHFRDSDDLPAAFWGVLAALESCVH
ncbi:hypothetical protein CY34DRAFT_808909 [Suillus luteus UH-Slu-Lm8-n1]|uniref:Uncharacterized protein n=1 Tax=Suillus luteus UH-Slu-Lm8-n1 TaxID=930992 RepID=A0A0C9ZMR6_9AGAM|nr:hypothetical protein CY34DRAFT_808909 [Suillus luteus UH-Slu-Lm8-n1]